MIRSIVVGTDGSDAAQRAVAVAASLAYDLGATVHLVHAVDHAVSGADGDATEARLLAQWAAPLEAAHVVWCTEVHDGAPATVLADVARETRAQLLVVGNRGAHPESGLFLGTTAHGLAHRTPVALLVVPVVQHVASIGDPELMTLAP
jgi:nucleotide-binding universal stress UspA family protein